ncbi:cytochrome P450 [Venturia nashicola]|nr:cytochrome P450 [Venturia nashicola]
MVEIEIKSLLATLASPESLMGVLLLAGALLLFRSTLFGPDLSHIPVVDAELTRAQRWENFRKDQKGVYARGYQQFNGVFYVDSPEGRRVVLPPHLMDEIKNMKEEYLDNIGALNEQQMPQWTGVQATTPFMNHLVKSNLTVALNRINPRLARTAAEAVEAEMPSCPDWTQLPFSEKLLRIVAIVSGDIFLGPEMCRNEDYLGLSINYTENAFKTIYKLRTYWMPLRPIVSRLLPGVKALERERAKNSKLLRPLIKQRRKLMEQGGELPDDMLQWSLEKASKFPDEIKSDDDIALLQLRLSMSAIHTTSLTGTVLLADICSIPGLLQELRAEWEAVLERSGGEFSTKALYEMKLLDSVMKESQRMHMLGPAMYHNKTRRGITLSDGTYIPAGVPLRCATLAGSRDPAHWPNPDKFDPYRFLKLRQASEEEAGKHQFVTVQKEMMSFGYGKHACSGRFFAANELKIIFINILRKYDVETREGKLNRRGQPEFFWKNVL